MRVARALRRAIVVPLVALAIVGVAAAIVWSDLEAAERALVAGLATPARAALVVLCVAALAAVLGIVVWRMGAPEAAAVTRIAESARLAARSNASHRIARSDVPPALAGLADAVNALADAHSRAVHDSERTAADAKARVEAERTRLAALVAELDQAVLVCNRDGRVLLYNAAATALLSAAADGRALGLGRSIFGLLGRAVVVHAVEALERQLERHDRESVHFVTATGDARLVRVRAAAVAAPGDEASPVLAGYVLLLSDVTEHVDADTRRAALLQGFVETTRGGLANIRAAIETLTDHPDMDAARKARFVSIVRDESVALSERLDATASELGAHFLTRWPLEDVLGEDLLTLAERRIARDARIRTLRDEVDAQLWLSADSFSLTQALEYLARRLADEFGVREVRFRLAASGGHAQLDIAWRGPPLSSETAFAWQRDPFASAGVESPLTLAEVMQRHGGEAWYQRDVPTQVAYFRLLVPLAQRRTAPPSRPAIASRPEFYDFDLFRRSPASDALDERRLDELAYTVFDTETTGLDPGAGDEIIAIGAVRIVNGRVLGGETFESLVDPQRSLTDESVAIHGITPAMLRGQPGIAAVLPRFHRFAEETVLVGHNAAFDMRFLEMKEASTGIRFDHPVLDTLLLSAVVHPAQPSHSLEEIAERLGVPVVGRHTALGDAMVTAEVFVRLLPLLEAQGIETLAQARAAAQRTLYARLAY